MSIIQIVTAILVPPLGVFLTVGLGPTFLINLLLTVLGWIPGSIHALWVVSKQAEKASDVY